MRFGEDGIGLLPLNSYSIRNFLCSSSSPPTLWYLYLLTIVISSNRTTFHSLTFCSHLGVGHTRNGLHPRFVALATEKQLKPAKVSSFFSKRFLSTASFHVFCEGLELELLLNLIVVTLMPVVDTYVRTVLVVLARY